MMSSSKRCRRHFRVIAETDSIVDVMSVGLAVGSAGSVGRERGQEKSLVTPGYVTTPMTPTQMSARHRLDPLQGREQVVDNKKLRSYSASAGSNSYYGVLVLVLTNL
eukprot:scaffold32614_cov202-Skeletonema_dohrnii-CCMP3373.AAC.2